MKVVIIGGGVIGYCTAFFLRKSGHQVTILEKSTGSSSPSYWNAGMVVPSHFTPLAAPGVVAKGLKWMFSKSSPFSIKMNWETSFIRWLWQFYRHANQAHVNNSIELLRDLNQTSSDLFDEILSEISMQKKQSGLLMIYNTEKGRDEEHSAARVASKLGIDAQVLSASELGELDRTVTYEAKGAVYYPEDAFLPPANFMDRLEVYLTDHGVSILKGEEVIGFETNGKSIEGVRTKDQYYSGDRFVLAAGSFSDDLTDKLQLKLLLQGGKGYSITVSNPPEQPSYCSVLSEAKVAITPMETKLRLAGTMEIVGKDLSINQARVNGYLKSVEQYLPAFDYSSLVEEPVWAGLRPCSPDGLPYIGVTDKAENLVVCTGHAMMGFSLGPVSGKIADQITNDQRPSVDISLLSPDRYC